MKHRKIIGVIATVMLLTGLSVMPVLAQPPVCSFSGTVTLDGNPVDAGTTITAKAAGTVVGTGEAYIEDSTSKYFVLVPQADGVPAEGAAINLYVVVDSTEYLGGSGTWNAGGTKTVNLAAVSDGATNPDISVTTSLPFGSVAIGASKTMTLTISNVGAATLTITSITITGSQFSRGTYSGTIAAGSSATVNVTFSPTSTGAKSATLTIASNDPDEASVAIALSGTGITRPQTFAWWLYGTFIEPFM